MYTEHIIFNDYNEVKQSIIDYINGDNDKIDLEEISEYLQDLYENNKIPSTQYDELMGYLQDLM